MICRWSRQYRLSLSARLGWAGFAALLAAVGWNKEMTSSCSIQGCIISLVVPAGATQRDDAQPNRLFGISPSKSREILHKFWGESLGMLRQNGLEEPQVPRQR